MSEVALPLLKDPDEIIDVSVDWTDYLAAGETVSSAAWAIEGGDQGATGALAISGTPSLATPVATAFLKDGTLRQVYRVRCRAVTNQGRTVDRSWTVRIGHR